MAPGPPENWDAPVVPALAFQTSRARLVLNHWCWQLPLTPAVAFVEVKLEYLLAQHCRQSKLRACKACISQEPEGDAIGMYRVLALESKELLSPRSSKQNAQRTQ